MILKAVARHRQLARAAIPYPGATLARCLEALADHLAMVRAWDEALAALEEAVMLTRKLAVADPHRFLLPLAGRVLRLSLALYEAGNIVDAIMTAREATGMYRQMSGGRPPSAGHDFVGALTHLSCTLAVTGDAQAALTTMREAVAEHRKLYAVCGGGEEASRLAWSLGLLGMRLRLAGNIDGARAATAEAIALLGQAGPLPDVVFTYLCREYESLSGPIRDRLFGNGING